MNNFCTPSGVDIRIFFKLKDGKSIEMSTIQAITFEEDFLGQTSGTLISLIVDNDVLNQYRFTIQDIELKTIIEEKEIMKASFENVIFQKRAGGVSIDDLVMEMSYNFTATKFDSWKKL